MARTVLFSNPEIATYINENFEPTWQSVREVPTITIDFGSGKSVKRTLNGNIASYVCTSNGKILDVLPGLYEARSYKDRLQQLKMLHSYIATLDGVKSDDALFAYHKIQLQRLERGQMPMRFAKTKENGIEAIKLSAKAKDPDRNWTVPIDEETMHRVIPPPKNDIASWEKLSDDVRYNETSMRKQIHAHLLNEMTTHKAAAITSFSKWLYREVLHVDLDDPYLGLKPVLSDNYPFERSMKN
ncbi:MAG: hypothetical protein K2X81_19080 [Candidatus Obscuribacterales bacterium]|nr:hypothetical protein [Candidatus Obscuribacterales bacterium]